MPAVLCYGLCHMSIQEFTECCLTRKKAGLCTVMSMWLVHIKRTCVVRWNMPNHCTSIYREWVGSAAVKGQMKRYCLAWDGGPVCSPGSWSGRGWLPLSEEQHSMCKNGLAEKVVKCPHNGNISRCAISSPHYHYHYLKIIITTIIIINITIIIIIII